MMIALVLSAAVASQMMAAVPAATAPGWAFVSYSGDLNTEVLVHAAETSAASPYRYIWVRYEFEKTAGLATPLGAPHPPRSEVVYAQIDCAQQKSRPLQITDYLSSNLSGQSFNTIPANQDWLSAKPDTFAEEIDPIACRAGEDAAVDIMLSPAKG